MFGEPVQLPPGRLGRAQRLAERDGEVGQHTDVGATRRGVPLFFFFPERTPLLGSGQLFRILGGRAFRGGALGFTDYVFDLVRPDAGPGHDADAGAVAAPVDGDDSQLAGR